MKIGGIKLAPTNIRRVPIVREDMVFYFEFEPLDNYNDFDALCPEPKAQLHGGYVGQDSKVVENKSYTEEKSRHYNYLTHFIFLRSLKRAIIRKRVITEEFFETLSKDIQTAGPVEWETVDINDPTTWHNWLEELKDFGLTSYEISMLQSASREVNSISEREVTKALDNFLAVAVEEVSLESFFQDALGSTVSTRPALDLESALPE